MVDFPSPPVHYEKVSLFSMEPHLRTRYEAFEQEITEQVVQMLNEGDSSGLEPWFLTLLRFPDMPWLPWTCQTRREVVLGEVPARLSEKTPTNLEKGLTAYIEQHYRQHLPVLVFTENTGRFDDQDHLKQLFELLVRDEAGKAPNVAVLREHIHPMNRTAWLWNRREEGLDVLVCNPALVAGLDMRAFPRIIYKRPPVTLSRLRQSAHCSFRPGQAHDVEVVFCMYESSMALRWFHRMASGVPCPEPDMLAQLAREVWAECLQRGGVK